MTEFEEKQAETPQEVEAPKVNGTIKVAKPKTYRGERISGLRRLSGKEFVQYRIEGVLYHVFAPLFDVSSLSKAFTQEEFDKIKKEK